MQDPGVPARLMRPAIIVGLLVLGIGLFVFIFVPGIHSPPAVYAPWFVMSVGAAILLGAFGTRAEGTWGPSRVVGVGALAIVLFILVTHFAKPNWTKTGRIEVTPLDFQKVAILSIIDDHPFYLYRDLSTNSFQFIVLKDKFMNRCIKVEIYTNEQGPGKEYFRLDGDGDKISEKYLRNDWDSAILWDLDYHGRKITDGRYGNVVFKMPEPQDEGSIVTCDIALKSNVSSSYYFSSSSAAFAQPIQRNDRLVDPVLIHNLTMDDPALRRGARDALAAIGPTAVAPMLNAWHRSPEDYRLKLGTVLVINDILRNDPDMRIEISRKLNDDDIGLLVNSASDNDDTVSEETTELLYVLKDRRAVSASIAAVQRNTNENGVFNNVLILKSIFPELSEFERYRVTNDLKSSIPVSYARTLSLLKSFDP
jgi:hypothetical protein